MPPRRSEPVRDRSASVTPGSMVFCNEQRTDDGSQALTAAWRPANPDDSRLWGASPPHERLAHGSSMSQKRERMKRALVTIVIANLGGMGVFSQEVLPIEPQISRGTSVDFPLEARALALWRQSAWVAFGDHIEVGRSPSHGPDEVCRRGS
jgi:hypothetical protein